MMENPEEVSWLRARGRELYGNPDGPNFGRLLAEHRKSGATHNEAYGRIIQGAQVTNSEVDERFRKKQPGS